MKNVKHTVLSFLGIVALSVMLISCYSLWDDLSSVLVTFNGNNGIGTMEPQIFVSKVPQTINENKFTREGYTFAGWATKADASTAEYADKESFTATKDITLYAIWSLIPPTKYTITYNSNSGSGTMEPQIFEENVPQALSENKFTREGYTFAGWATAADASEAGYADKASFTATKDITLYAIWSVIPPVPSKYTITYVSTYGSKPANKEVDKGYKLTAEDLPDLTETGYRFIKWDKAVGDEISSDTTITATWKKLVTISYASNKTELNNTLPASKTVEEGYKLTADDLSTLTANGYNFKGWDKSAGDVISSNTTITANWKKLVTISYASNKTELNDTLPDSKTVEEGYKLTADDLSTLTANGYNFKGWDKSAGDVISSDTTITASWKKLVTISYASNKTELSDKLPASKPVEEGYTLTAADLADLTEGGYNFKGWDKTAGDVISSNTTITASWKKLVTISYSSTYGTKPDNKNVEEGYTLTATDLPDLGETSDKYFDSWDKAVGALITADTTITTITANWEDIVYLKKLTSFSEISSNKAKIEKIVFTSDTYSGAATPVACADNSTNPAISPDYFKGVLTDGTVSGQYILTIYGNGHRIYAPIDCSQLFANYQKLTTIEFNNFYTSKTTNMTGMFAMSNALNSLNVSGFNTAKVTNMTGMFTGYKGTELNLSNFDTSKVVNMQNMFQACTNLTTLNISSFNTSAVTNMFNMFYGCSSLTSLDVSKFDTAKVTTMKQMFADCYGLEELDLSSFDTSEVTDMSVMFYCTDTDKSNLKKIIFSSKFKTDKVTTVKQMFYRCDKLTELDISSFDTSSVLWTSMGGCGLSIFNGCSSLVTIYASDKFVSTAPNLTIFDGCTSLVGGAGTTCDGTNNITAAYAHIDGGSSNPGYFTLKQ